MKEVLLTSSVLILALTALRFLFRRSISRRLQYALWLLVGLRLLIPAALLPASPFSVLSGAETLARRWESAAVQAAPDTAANAAQTAVADRDTLQLSQGTGTSAPAQPGAEASLTVDAGASAPVKAAPARTEIVRWAWAGGAAAVLGWLLAVNLRFLRQLRKTRRTVDVAGSPLPVYVTGAVVSPCLFGLFRPAVYLTPKALETEDSLRHVLTHELCHYRHGDHIWALLRSVLCALYWFDPLVWLAASLSRADSELACDEAVLRKLGADQRLAYGRTLVDMVAVRQSPAGILCAATTMTSGKRGLRARLERIVQAPRTAVPAVMAAVLLAAVCAACTFTGAATTDAAPAETDAVDVTDQATAAEVTFTLFKMENGEETPISDPGDLAEELYFDAMVKSAAAEAVELPDTYYTLTSTETPMDGGETTVREYQIFRLYDGPGPFLRGTPVMQHGDMYTAIHYELMARLEASANPQALPAISPDPKASAHQDVLIDYADDNTVIFHGYFGLFVYDRNSGSIIHSLDLDAAIGTSQVYDTSENYAEVAVSRDGRVLRVAARGDADPLEALWIDTASWTGGTGPWAELRQPFGGGASAVTTEDGETVSVDLGGGRIGDVQLATGDGTLSLFSGTAALPTDLDAAVSAAVLNWYADQEPGVFLAESHWRMATERGTDGTVTAYCQVRCLPFAGDADAVAPAGAGRQVPMALTFQEQDSGGLTLLELWAPSGGDLDGTIRARFPASAADAAVDPDSVYGGSNQMAALERACWAQAIAYFGADMTEEVDAAVDTLSADLGDTYGTMTALEAAVEQGIADEAVAGAWRTALGCSDTALRCCFDVYLHQGAAGYRDAVLWRIMETLLGDQAIPYAARSGQDYFDHWQSAMLRAYEQDSRAFREAGGTAGLLLLETMGML